MIKMLRSALPTLLVASGLLVGAAVAPAPAYAQTDGEHHRHHGPPPREAFAACENHAAGDACQVTFHDKTHDGTCRKAPPDKSDAALACLPVKPPERQ